MNATINLRRSEAVAPDGTKLAVFESGPRDAPPVLLIHGISQSHLAFSEQLCGELARDYRVVAFDLRGHGSSDKPLAGYDQQQTWADDVAAVIHRLELVRPIIVGWSFGMIAALDHVAQHGEANIAGLLLLAGPLVLSPDTAPSIIGDAFRDALPGLTSDNVDEAVGGVALFLRGAANNQRRSDDDYRMIGYNMVVPAYVRRGMFARNFDHRTTLARVRVPVIYAVGSEDRIIPPAVLEQADGLLHVQSRRIEGASHIWFAEEPDRFMKLLDQLVSNGS